MGVYVSERPAASMFRVKIYFFCREYAGIGSLKQWYLSAKLLDVTSQNTVIFTVTAVKTSESHVL
jgi:hypothetical protein